MDTFQSYQTGNLCVQGILWEPGEVRKYQWGINPLSAWKCKRINNTLISLFIYCLKRFSKKEYR